MQSRLSIFSSSFALPILLGCALLLTACTKKEGIGTGFADSFEGDHLSAHWFDTIGRYAVMNGALNINGAYNHPLWLKKWLPVAVDIEFDAKSLSKEGDIKFELFGDGRSFALNKGQYVATGYVFCMGGWGNQKTFIARRAEHARNLLFTTKTKVEQGKWHHFKVESRTEGGHLILNWYIDTKLVLSMRDKHPLYGKHNRWFGFSNWATDVWFDNLKITPR